MTKFNSVPKKTPHLHDLFKRYFAEHNDVRASLVSVFHYVLLSREIWDSKIGDEVIPMVSSEG